MKIFYIVGPSGSGKDSLYSSLLEIFKDELSTIILYTNRPIRSNEVDGVTYHFRTTEQMKSLKRKGLIVENREYNTIRGKWIYATVNDGGFHPDKNYLGIGTLESLIQIRDYFGPDIVVPLYVYVPTSTRFLRLTKRETEGKQDYDEMCRRWMADSKDFSEENIQNANPNYIINDSELKYTVCQAESLIRMYLAGEDEHETAAMRKIRVCLLPQEEE